MNRDFKSRYELGEEIGRGGIGVVFRARDRVLGRELAVKVLQSEHQDRPELRQHFLAEAQIGSQLQHPAIIPVHEFDVGSDRRPYFTMKLVDGRTLAAILKTRDYSARNYHDSWGFLRRSARQSLTPIHEE